MDTHIPNLKSQSMRVLVRPPNPTPPVSPHPLPPPTPPDPPQNGVVVVGFIGRRHEDVAQLMNRIIDSNVFGSGNLDKPFRIEDEKNNAEIKKWLESRKLSFFQDEDKGILYLQFASARCPVMDGSLESQFGLDSVFEDQELGDLQGLLFMFSVCHIIILIQEGSRFDTKILKKFRVLQAAKHAMAPFVKSQNTEPVTSGLRSSSSRISLSGASSNNPSPVKSRGILNRNASTITLMSGLGSYTALLPGQCTPVILFVFLDDFSDIHQSGNMEEHTETSLLNQSSSLNSLARPTMTTKGSGSVVVLARPVNKIEGGPRKKLQSSLEGQIRFSIKKCRTLSGSETTHAGSRNGGISSLAPLFSLDASKAVALLDVCLNQSGESLEFAIGIIEDILKGKMTSDSLLLESHSQSANREDILSVKEFIYRQSDILRGRSSLVTSTASSSAAGVGMVAVAAAAAAASAASGKSFTAPELPSLEMWLSSCQLILHGILSARHGCMDKIEINPSGENAHKASDPLESAVSYLESGIGLNTKFSTSWCQKALPVAKEVYLNELPPCYPSCQHEAHLKKALHAFNSMVKGPAVQLYMKKLEDECTSIWSSGRQLCDAVSLTGKPCMHQRHDQKTLMADDFKPHSSGYVFLHACACGRSRLLQPDPFDFETANVIYSCFPDCEKLLPAVKLPQVSIKDPVQPSAWCLVRIGGARYYEPSKGLFQSGFCATQKFLMKWTIFLEKQEGTNHSPLNGLEQVSLNRLGNNIKAEAVAEAETKTSGSAQLQTGRIQSGGGMPKRPSSDNIKVDDKNISFGRGLYNFTMRKPFSEVVAGSAATNSGFPPLLSRKPPLPDAEKGVKQHGPRYRGTEKISETSHNQESQKVDKTPAIDESLNGNETVVDAYGAGNPFLNKTSVNMNGNDKIKMPTSLKHVTIYVGFEHECPRGHRFILNQDHLNELGSPYAVPEKSTVGNSDHKEEPANLGKIGGHGKTRRQSNGVVSGGSGKARTLEKSKGRVANQQLYNDKHTQYTRPPKEHIGVSAVTASVKDLESSLQPAALDDGGCAFSMLNRSLPVYMNCPHCKDSMNKKDPSNNKFASAVSQLQRIFVVTPPFPVILAAGPVIQFEASCLPTSVVDSEKELQFSMGCQVILPPESFLSLKLPFVYGVRLEDGSLHSLKPSEHQPHMTAWITEGTTLQVVSKISPDQGRLV
ncbi:uncharacterized protein LOC111400298 isoform X1 [Olea europaea subsp. europaea]|uniref:Nonsense-mediated mRNA decay factor SMG8 n=1 Tax=Olea europaea subsp. europaea TaxID=158383 RepID=A0A8S0PXT3_OLEEU|nr:uncharacterized protein LOC111400298 isoform X1 [Olea europaea subsp. europaea]